MGDVRKGVTGTWDKLESVFEERVARALHSLNVPTKKDIDALSARIHELTLATRKLSASTEAEKAADVVGEAVEKAGEVVKMTTKKVASAAKAAKEEAARAAEDVKTDLAG